MFNFGINMGFGDFIGTPPKQGPNKGRFTWAQRAGGFAGSVLGSTPGREFRQGIGESFGFEYEKGINKGFLGRKLEGGMMSQGKFAFASRLFGVATLGLSAISGYQENGVTGATMNVAKNAATWGAIRAGWSVGKGVLSNPWVLGGAAIGATAYAGYKIGQASREKARRIRNVEMGGEVLDRFGTVSTIRQRSLMALNNSHVNGRMALGNEAILLSSNYLR